MDSNELNVTQLERASEIADARLGVAEDFSWPVGLLAGTACYMGTNSYLLAAFGLALGYAASLYPYRRIAKKAEDEYFKAARLGRYMPAGKP